MVWWVGVVYWIQAEREFTLSAHYYKMKHSMAAVAGDMLAQLRKQHVEVMRETVSVNRVRNPEAVAVPHWWDKMVKAVQGGAK